MANQKLYFLSLDNIPSQDANTAFNGIADNFFKKNNKFFNLAGKLNSQFSAFQSFNNYKNTFGNLANLAEPPTHIPPIANNAVKKTNFPQWVFPANPMQWNLIGSDSTNFSLSSTGLKRATNTYASNKYPLDPEIAEWIVTIFEMRELVEPFLKIWLSALRVYGDAAWELYGLPALKTAGGMAQDILGAEGTSITGVAIGGLLIYDQWAKALSVPLNTQFSTELFKAQKDQTSVYDNSALQNYLLNRIPINPFIAPKFPVSLSLPQFQMVPGDTSQPVIGPASPFHYNPNGINITPPNAGSTKNVTVTVNVPPPAKENTTSTVNYPDLTEAIIDILTNAHKDSSVAH